MIVLNLCSYDMSSYFIQTTAIQVLIPSLQNDHACSRQMSPFQKIINSERMTGCLMFPLR